MTLLKRTLGLILLAIGMSGAALAIDADGAQVVPEIDGSSAVTAMALVSGALVLVRSRRSK